MTPTPRRGHPSLRSTAAASPSQSAAPSPPVRFGIDLHRERHHQHARSGRRLIRARRPCRECHERSRARDGNHDSGYTTEHVVKTSIMPRWPGSPRTARRTGRPAGGSPRDPSHGNARRDPSPRRRAAGTFRPRPRDEIRTAAVPLRSRTAQNTDAVTRTSSSFLAHAGAHFARAGRRSHDTDRRPQGRPPSQCRWQPRQQPAAAGRHRGDGPLGGQPSTARDDPFVGVAFGPQESEHRAQGRETDRAIAQRVGVQPVLVELSAHRQFFGNRLMQRCREQPADARLCHDSARDVATGRGNSRRRRRAPVRRPGQEPPRRRRPLPSSFDRSRFCNGSLPSVFVVATRAGSVRRPRARGPSPIVVAGAGRDRRHLHGARRARAATACSSSPATCRSSTSDLLASWFAELADGADGAWVATTRGVEPLARRAIGASARAGDPRGDSSAGRLKAGDLGDGRCAWPRSARRSSHGSARPIELLANVNTPEDYARGTIPRLDDSAGSRRRPHRARPTRSPPTFSIAPGRSAGHRHRDAAQPRAGRPGGAGRVRAGAPAAQGAARDRAGAGGRRSAPIAGVARVEATPNGYLNFFLDRAAFTRARGSTAERRAARPIRRQGHRRTHGHQSEQGGAHRASAQRGARRHARAAAALSGPAGRGAELHRRHRRAGRRRRRRLHRRSKDADLAGVQRSRRRPARPVRLLLLGSLRAGDRVVRRRTRRASTIAQPQRCTRSRRAATRSPRWAAFIADRIVRCHLRHDGAA